MEPAHQIGVNVISQKQSLRPLTEHLVMSGTVSAKDHLNDKHALNFIERYTPHSYYLDPPTDQSDPAQFPRFEIIVRKNFSKKRYDTDLSRAVSVHSFDEEKCEKRRAVFCRKEIKSPRRHFYLVSAKLIGYWDPASVHCSRPHTFNI
jgi:hypothetical protein